MSPIQVYRCISFKRLGLLFKGAATIIQDGSSLVPIGLFEITQECEDSSMFMKIFEVIR